MLRYSKILEKLHEKLNIYLFNIYVGTNKRVLMQGIIYIQKSSDLLVFIFHEMLHIYPFYVYVGINKYVLIQGIIYLQ